MVTPCHKNSDCTRETPHCCVWKAKNGKETKNGECYSATCDKVQGDAEKEIVHPTQCEALGSFDVCVLTLLLMLFLISFILFTLY